MDGTAGRTAAQRRLVGATAAVAVAGLAGTGLVVATVSQPATRSVVPGGSTGLQQVTVRGDDGYEGQGDDGVYGFVPQVPSGTGQPPIASSHGS